MENNRGQSIFLSVVGIATLLVAIVGATFAYFSITVQGNENASSIHVKTATLGNVIFNDGSDAISVNNAYPGWSAQKTITISLASDDANAEVQYTIKLNTLNNELSASTVTQNEFNYSYTCSQTTGSAGTISASGSGEMPKTTGLSSALVTNTLKGTNVHSCTFTFTLVEESSAQNYLQGLTYEGKFQVDVANDEIKRTWDAGNNTWKEYVATPQP